MTYREHSDDERDGDDVVVFGANWLESTTSIEEEVEGEHFERDGGE